MQAPIEHAWSPYADNGGTSISVSGPDYAVLVSDTRLSSGYRIHTRDCSKVTQLTDKCVLASCGMKADAITLHRLLKARIVMYEHAHRRQPSVTAIAQMLSTMLYQKRFFPFYTFNNLVGVDDEGKGACYHYDAIGSFERVPYGTEGSGSALTLSVLDAQLAKAHQQIKDGEPTMEQVVELCKDALTSCGERDIYTGDKGEIFVINSAGVSKATFDLKKD